MRESIRDNVGVAGGCQGVAEHCCALCVCRAVSQVVGWQLAGWQLAVNHVGGTWARDQGQQRK